jgi:serine/threonine protein kinase
VSETLADGRFRVERTLGRGGMAIVYLAHDEELHRSVAVKVLGEHVSTDKNARTRFFREARFAARLSHPNVVHVYDAGETGGRPFIVMEYVPGRTLAELGQLPTTETVQLALQACAGLQHAHETGLIHRDVKPGNLLLREDGVLKVADFGIARTADTTHLTQLGTILGTAAYLAPEQAAGEEVTAAADIYSLGAVLYELLTGRPTYRFDSLAELAEKQGGGLIAPVRDVEPAVPEAVEAVVMRCLAHDPRFRPASADEVAHDLAAAVKAPTEPLLATALTEPLRARRYESIPGSGAWLLIAVAAAVALAAVVLGLLQLGDGGSGSSSPTPTARVAPPARGETAAAEARSLSAWLRRHSR